MGAGVLASALTMAACGSEPEADADGDGTITQDEVETVLANSDLVLTPGEWENTVEFGIRRQPIASRSARDDGADP